MGGHAAQLEADVRHALAELNLPRGCEGLIRIALCDDVTTQIERLELVHVAEEHAVGISKQQGLIAIGNDKATHALVLIERAVAILAVGRLTNGLHRCRNRQLCECLAVVDGPLLYLNQ